MLLRYVFLLLLCACSCSMDFIGLEPGEDGQAAIEDMGWRVVYAPMKQQGFTACLTKTVLISRDLKGTDISSLLAHEYVHVVQAEILGCTRFWARILTGELEIDAYLSQWEYDGCSEQTRPFFEETLRSYGYDGELPEC